MDLKTVKIKDLKPAAYNPRKELTKDSKEYNKIKNSLDRFGLVQPIVWNEKTGNIVGGHQRFYILKDQGVKDFQVVVVSLDDKEEKALNITLNNTAVSGDWDFDKLTEIVEEIAESDFDTNILGFDEDEINAILAEPDIPDEAEPDAPGAGAAEEAGLERVSCTVTISSEEWDFFKAELDEIVNRFNTIEVHVKK